MTDTLHSIAGVEIFRVGTWNGDTFTRADLEAMVEAFDRVGYRPPVKLGHKERSGDPAYGWVTNLYRIGDRLLADIADVPRKLYDAIKRRAYDSVSSEIYFDLRRNGQLFRRALKAVALLGAEIPGVAGLAPLRSVINALPTTAYGRLAAYSFQNGDSNMDDCDVKTMSQHEAGTEVHKRTMRLLADGEVKTYAEGFKRVLASDPDLKRAYAGYGA